VAAGLFRDDLYRRLSAVVISVAPLRERREDIPSLVDYFTREFAVRTASAQFDAPEISSAARDAFSRAEWPGNVGQLKDVVIRQLLAAAGLRKRTLRAVKRELVNS